MKKWILILSIVLNTLFIFSATAGVKTYNEQGQLIKEVINGENPDGTGNKEGYNYVLTYEYDDNGKLAQKIQTSMCEQGQCLTKKVYNYEYDAKNHVTETVQLYNGENIQQLNEISPSTKQYFYQYDDNGNLLTKRGTDGSSYSYDYYEDGKLKSQTDKYGRVTTYEYYESGQLHSETLTANGVNSTYTYQYEDTGDGNYKVTKCGNGSSSCLTSEYDINGNRISQGNEHYTYNDDGFITEYSNPNFTRELKYGDNGEIQKIEETSNGSTTNIRIFDDEGKKIEQHDFQNSDNSRYDYYTEYNEYGEHTSDYGIAYHGDILINESYDTAVLDENGHRIGADRTDYQYNYETGKLEMVRHDRWTENGNMYNKELYYWYDEDGKLISSHYHEEDGTTFDNAYNYRYDYDENGNLISKIQIEAWHGVFDEQGYTSSYDQTESVIETYKNTKDGYILAYDGDGNMIGKYDTLTALLKNKSVEFDPSNPDGRIIRRIYTIEEAAKVSKPTGNTFRLRYK